MTTLINAPVSKSFAGINVLELEITGKCQLTCEHCLSESSPRATHGTMTPADWQAVIVDAAALGIPQVQLIGGEPTVNPHWIQYTDLAADEWTAPAAGRSGPSTREQQLEAGVADLTQALGEAAVELRVWKRSAEGRLGPSGTSR